MGRLNKENVKHVAELSKLSLTEEELERYEKNLNAIWSDIGKIIDVEIDKDASILISPIENKNIFSEKGESTMLSHEEIFRGVPNRCGDYVAVPKVIHD